MKRSIFSLLAALALVLLTALPVAAEEESADLNVSGFIDTHYGKLLKSGDGEATNNSGGFFLDAVVVYLDKPLGEKYRVFADLGFYNDGGASVDQAFAEGRFLDDQLTFTFGKFDAPIGFELVDAPDMYQFSHSIVYDNLIPGYHTGLMANFAPNDWFSVIAYVTNGIDTDFEDNKEKAIGGRLGVSFEKFGGGVSFVRANTTNDADGGYNEDASTQIIDVDLAATPVENLTLGGEFNLNTEDDGTSDRTAMGILAMAHYDFITHDTYTLGCTLRGGYIDWDADNDMTQTELTAALTGVLDPAGATFVLEYRMDDVDYKDAPDDTDTHAIALEWVFLF